MPVERQKIMLGQTVKLSEPGRCRIRTVSPELHGVVVGFSRTGNAYRIQFPDRKSTLTLHLNYVERVDAALPEADDISLAPSSLAPSSLAPSAPGAPRPAAPTSPASKHRSARQHG